jgi:hypothetical protein
VSSARFQRALPTSSRWCLLPLGYEDMEPPPGADPGHPPYESGAAAVRGGKLAILASNQELRVQGPAGLPYSPNGHRVRKARVERASREI